MAFYDLYHKQQMDCTRFGYKIVPAAKRDVWDDMKTLMAKMGVTL